ncbi:MAG: HEPN domain-containing protein [Candidatus Electryonea clarkiae]|nr:HEPN domain-containing protein [Candidatus Electryonea clarkiae]MDP8287734.1 HEPN domain-containing protein [Candidatus Electryonea clarkiae]
MPHDPVLIEETNRWFLKAKDDLKTAEITLKEEPPLLSTSVFHSQQAVEKAFKGFLVWHQVPFRKTHNLEEIGEQVISVEPELKYLIDETVYLTIYAWKYRYPDDIFEPDKHETKEALNVAKKAFEVIISHLPREVKPL